MTQRTRIKKVKCPRCTMEFVVGRAALSSTERTRCPELYCGLPFWHGATKGTGKIRVGVEEKHVHFLTGDADHEKDQDHSLNAR